MEGIWIALTIHQTWVYFNQLQIDVRILMRYKQTAARYVASAVTSQSRFRSRSIARCRRAYVRTYERAYSFSEYCWRLQVFPRKSARKFTSRRNATAILQWPARDKCGGHEHRADVAACLREKLCVAARKFAVYGKSRYTAYYNARDVSNKSLLNPLHVIQHWNFYWLVHAWYQAIMKMHRASLQISLWNFFHMFYLKFLIY